MPSWLTILFCFQIGWIPNGELIYYQPNKNVFTGGVCNQFDGTFKIDAIAFNIIEIGGKMISYFSFNNNSSTSIRFSPMGMTFSVYFGIMMTENISIRAEHYCTHPQAEYFNIHPGIPSFDSGYDRIYIEIKGKLE
jgi:hypothetical protein